MLGKLYFRSFSMPNSTSKHKGLSSVHFSLANIIKRKYIQYFKKVILSTLYNNMGICMHFSSNPLLS